jgi:uncharacterized phage infection (PIP) family protein YhgE
MAWCITLSNEEVNVEFSDEMPLGRKIAICESIVTALRNMDCPHRISPHQIQGLDCAKLLPACQWLVKAVLSTQSVREARMRKQAIENLGAVRKHAAIALLSEAPNRYLPKRKFRIVSSKRLSDPVRVYSTLLEFGDDTVSAAYSRFMKAEEADSSVSKPEPQRAIETRLNFQAEAGESDESLPVIDEEMRQVSIPMQERLSGTSIAKIVGEQSSEISSAIREYEEQRKREEEQLSQQRLELEKHNIAVSRLTKEIQRETEGIEELRERLQEMRESERKEAAALAETAALAAKITESIQNIDENTSEIRKKMSVSSVRDIELLSERKNALREEQRVLKEKWAAEEAQLAQLRDSDMIDPETKQWFEKIERAHADVSDRYEKARGILGEKNRAVARLQRTLENTPSKTELTQYQKRFVELYDKINLKLEENRKFYGSYNSSIELKALIENHSNLLTGFQEGFKNSKGRTQREAFAKNVQEAISQLGENRNRAKRKLEELKTQLSELEREFTQVQEQERLYYQTLKEFQEAVNAEA